jgi:hypothetical protein
MAPVKRHFFLSSGYTQGDRDSRAISICSIRDSNILMRSLPHECVARERVKKRFLPFAGAGEKTGLFKFSKARFKRPAFPKLFSTVRYLPTPLQSRYT